MLLLGRVSEEIHHAAARPHWIPRLPVNKSSLRKTRQVPSTFRPDSTSPDTAHLMLTLAGLRYKPPFAPVLP